MLAERVAAHDQALVREGLEHGVGVDVATGVGYYDVAAGREEGAARPRQRCHGRRRVGDVGAEDQGEAVFGVGEDAVHIFRVAAAQPLDRDLAPAIPPLFLQGAVVAVRRDDDRRDVELAGG